MATDDKTADDKTEASKTEEAKPKAADSDEKEQAKESAKEPAKTKEPAKESAKEPAKESAKEPAKEPAKTKEPAKEPVEEPESEDEVDEDEDEGEDEVDEDEGEDEVDDDALTAPMPEVAPKGDKASTKESKEKAKPAAAEEASGGRTRRARPRGLQPVTPPPPAASLGKSVFLFVLVFGLLAVGFFVLGNSEPFGGAGNQPKWKEGQTVSVDLTLDPRDDVKLACASEVVVAGRRCEFESKTKKAADQQDPTLLKPYTTTDGIQLLAAGLWTQPELEKTKRPAERFTVKCSYKVEGKIKNPAVRWDPSGGWLDQTRDWHAGQVSGCKLQAP